MYSCIFVFFNQKTADDMRISDWSSDVCSSDLFRICLQYNLNGCVRILLTSAFSISSRNLSPLVGLGTAGSIHMKPQPDLEPTMPRVLVAEDDTLVRIAIAEALRDAGFRVMEAASADEALAYLEAEIGRAHV